MTKPQRQRKYSKGGIFIDRGGKSSWTPEQIEYLKKLCGDRENSWSVIADRMYQRFKVRRTPQANRERWKRMIEDGDAEVFVEDNDEDGDDSAEYDDESADVDNDEEPQIAEKLEPRHSETPRTPFNGSLKEEREGSSLRQPRIAWSDEEKAYLKELHENGKGWSQNVKKLNEKFGKDRTVRSCQKKMYRLKVREVESEFDKKSLRMHGDVEHDSISKGTFESGKKPPSTSASRSDIDPTLLADPTTRMFCRVFTTDQYSPTAVFNELVFVVLPLPQSASFEALRQALEIELAEFVPENRFWNFCLPLLGEVARNHESQLNAAVQLISELSSEDMGDGTAERPLRVNIVMYSMRI